MRRLTPWAGGVVSVVLLAAGAVSAQATPITMPPGRPAGTVVDWGSAGSGASGPPADLRDVVDVAAGDDFAVALKADGTVVTWGSTFSPDVTGAAGLTNVVAVSAAPWTGAALKRDGSIVTWGTYAPDATSLGSDNIAVSVGSGFLLALKTDHTVRAVGGNLSGQLDIPAGLDDVVAISAGGFRGVSGSRCGFGLALQSDGAVLGWGGAAMQVGCGSNFAHPGTPPSNLPPLVGIEAGSTYSLGITAGGAVVAWGDPTYANATPPAGLRNVVDLTAGEQGAAALHSDGSVTAWGSGEPVPSGLSATAVAVDYQHQVALTVPIGVGSPVLQTRVDSNAAGTAEAFRFTAARSGPVDRLRFFVDGSNRSTQVEVGLYTAKGANPANLLARNTIGVPAADRWAEIGIPSVTLTAGQTYWIAVLGPKGAGRFAFRDRPDGTGGGTQTSAQTGLTTLPATWKTGSVFANGPISAYAVPTGG